MNFFDLGNYRFRYYICSDTTNDKLSICFVPSSETETQFSKENEKPQKITYDLYECLENLLGSWMNFNPLFSQELSLFEIQVQKMENMNMQDISLNIRKIFQELN